METSTVCTLDGACAASPDSDDLRTTSQVTSRFCTQVTKNELRQPSFLLCATDMLCSPEEEMDNRPCSRKQSADAASNVEGAFNQGFDLKFHLVRLMERLTNSMTNKDPQELSEVLKEKALIEDYINVLKEQVNCALMETVTTGSTKMFKVLLESGADPLCFSQPLLVTAVDFNAKGVIYELIDHGFDVNLTGTHGTALHSAMRIGNFEIAEALYKAGALLDATDDSGTTPLHLAVQRKNLACVEWLLKRGCTVDPVDQTWGRTPLHWAAHFTNTEILRYLLFFGANLLALDKNGCAPWTLAITCKNLQALEVLFFEQDVNTWDARMKTPLHWCCRAGFLEGVDSLLRKGSNINSKDAEGITPLMDALALRQTRIADKLLRYPKINVQLKDGRGRTALHWACLTGSKKSVKLLILQGAVCDEKDFQGITPFQKAINQHHSEVALVLIKCGPFVINIKDETGSTPLHWVSRNGLAAIAHYLLKAGADVNSQNHEGRTPLMDAVLAGEVGVMKILIKNANIDVDREDCSKQTALHLLLAERPYTILAQLKLLAEAGANLNLPINTTGKPPLIHYIKHWPKLGEMLLTVGADPNLITKFGDTALLKAVESGCIDTVRCVLEANIDLDITCVRGKHGLTPVIEACSQEDTAIFRLLVNAGCSLKGVAQFLEETRDMRNHPVIDRELSWLERRFREPKTLMEQSRMQVNKAIGYLNYRKRVHELQIPQGLKEYLLLNGFLAWKERHSRFVFGDL